MGRRAAWVAGWAIVIVALTAAAVAVASARAGATRIVLRRPLPVMIRIDQRMTVRGRVAHAPAGARVALQSGANAKGPRWAVQASTSVPGDGAFRLRWHVGPHTQRLIQLRVVVLRGRNVVAATAPQRTFVGSRAIHCDPPAPPGRVPPGDGWIVGGAYLEGGPFPGIDECEGSAYTAKAIDDAGAVVTSETVPARHSYTLVVPAGHYEVQAGVCRGSATVIAGRQTKADAICAIP
jgi:hypothetical protein